MKIDFQNFRNFSNFRRRHWQLVELNRSSKTIRNHFSRWGLKWKWIWFSKWFNLKFPIHSATSWMKKLSHQTKMISNRLYQKMCPISWRNRLTIVVNCRNENFKKRASICIMITMRFGKRNANPPGLRFGAFQPNARIDVMTIAGVMWWHCQLTDLPSDGQLEFSFT